MRNKITDLKEIVTKTLPDILVIAETKIDKSFKTAQFCLENYHEPTRKDFSKFSGGVIEFVRKGVIRKHVPNFELKSFESIASEIIINKRKWLLLSFYRTERDENKSSNIKRFFKELSAILTEGTNKYDNIILMGGINIDFQNTNSVGYNDLTNFMTLFNLKNLIKDKTCFAKDHESSIDIILTNKQNSFLKSNVFELGISDCHKMITTTLRSHIPRIKSQSILYRSMKTFDKTKYMKDLKAFSDNITLTGTNMDYQNFTKNVTKLLDKHAPLKIKKVRGNQSSFMNKELSKAIMKRSLFRSKYLKNRNNENRANYKKQRNLCVKLRKFAINNAFKKSTTEIKENSSPFYKILKPFMKNKGVLSSNDITLFEKGRYITNDKNIGDIFNDYYINIIEYSTGKKPDSTDKTEVISENLINEILEKYKHHPSILNINRNHTFEEKFEFKLTNEKEVLLILKNLKPKKAVGIDAIPPLIVKESATIFAKPLTALINQSIQENTFPSLAKIAAVTPFFKKDDRSLKENYRPVSVLSTFSKIFGKVLKNQITSYSDKFLSPFVSAYRTNYSSQHVLMRLLEEWKGNLDQDNLVGAILMDLSKAFDCIDHGLLIAKLDAYGFSTSALLYVYSYLKGRRQCVKINNDYSKYLTILAGVPQGSILGPILFNIFINYLYFIIIDGNLHGYADDHTISASDKNLISLKERLINESNKAIDWLNDNKMLANPSKFQGIVLTKKNETIKTTFEIKEATIESANSVKLLGVVIDEKLNFETHIKNLCGNAGGQLNTLYRLKNNLTSFSKELAVNSFIASIFNYCPLVWHFSSAKSSDMIEKVQKRAIRFLDKEIDNDCTMNIKRLRILATEIFKTINNLNPIYMKDIFQKTIFRTSERLKFNLKSQKYNQVKYGKKSLRVLGPILWNSLPNQIKSSNSLYNFKRAIKSWGLKNCSNYARFLSYYMAI